MDAIEQRQAALSQLAALAPSPLTAPDAPVVIDEDGAGPGYFDAADGVMDDDEYESLLREQGQYVHWEQVARNLAAALDDGPGIFERQRKLHTYPLREALDALPPGVKAWLLIQSARVDFLEKQAERDRRQQQRDIEEFEDRLAKTEAAVERDRYAVRMGGE